MENKHENNIQQNNIFSNAWNIYKDSYISPWQIENPDIINYSILYDKLTNKMGK